MRAGYGRGYYGEGQLLQEPERRRGSGWIKLALVVGAGAVIWFMWPRKTVPGLGGGAGSGEDPRASQGTHGPSWAPLPQDMVAYDHGPPPSPQGPPSALGAPGLVSQPPTLHSPIVQQQQYPAPQAPAVQNPISQQQAYEDAVVASARQLQATGAKVVMAPHLAHLAPRLAP